MKSADGAASDGDEYEGIDLARDDRTTARGERCEGGHLQIRVDHNHANYEKGDSANLEIRGQVIARAKQHPYGQNGGDESVRGH